MLIAAILSAWLQYAADGKPHARAVTGDAVCPTASVDGRAVPMRVRAARRAGFADTVCDVAVPAAAKSVQVGGRALPPPVRDPRTIVVLGDTGCRITLLSAQSCNDPAAWQFPQIARSIAAAHPDLVIHVGDYLYREHGCPPLARCAGSPHGDDAPAWYADFLNPAGAIFAVAPVLLARGNHEECDRNGAGWFRYLDPGTNRNCTEATEPYAVDLGDLRIVSFDSAIAEDHAVDPARAPIYRRQFGIVHGLAGSGANWLVTHRPPYLNGDERGAMGDALAPYDAVLSGHIHFFAAMSVAALPPLLINGEGGTKLEPNYAPLLRFAVGKLHVEGEIFGSAHVGFGVYTRTSTGWDVSLRDAAGAELARCAIAGRAVTCRPGGTP